MPSTFFWTGNAIAIAGTLVTVNTAVTPNTFKHNALWSNPGNWQSFDSPAGIPQAGDDVVFPAGLDAAHKPPATGSGSTFTWPVNSEIDQNFQINNLTILDDNYHIDFFPGDSFGSPGPNGVPPNTPSTPTLTITGTIRTNIQKTLGSDTGLSLIGPLVPGASNLTIQLASAPGSSPGGLDAQSTGILKIGVPIIEPPVGSTFYVPGQTIGLTKTGPGTMEISGANSFTGLVSVNEGTLLATQSSALGSPSAATVVANGATLGIMQNPRINPITGAPLDPGTFRESFVLSGSGVGGAGALLGTIDPLTTFSGNAFGDTGTATVDGNINLVLPSTSPPTTSTAIGTAGSNVIVNGVVNGNGDLVKLGGGQLTLTNKNAYTGQTLINAGTLEIRNNDALSSSPLSTTTVATGATLQIRGNLIVPENLILNGDGALDLNGNSLGALRLDSAGSQAVWTGTVTLASNASIGVRNSNTPGLNTTLLTITGQVGGAFDLSKVDQGTLRLPNANNNFRGNTFVRNGVLQIASATALGPANVGSINVTNTGNVQGTLQVEGTYTIGKPVTLSGLGFNSGGALRVFENPVGLASNITLSGPITLGTSTSVVVDPVSSLNANGVISGANTASLDKLGLGSLTLAGTNTFLGNLNLREGTTVLTNGRGLGGANGGGTQVFTGASLVLPNPLTVAGEPLTLSGFGVNGQGVLQAPAGTTTWTGPVATAGASVAGVSVTEADINVAQNGVLNFSGVLSGDADLRKLGAGELRLTGSAPNQFTKATFIDVGTVALGKTSGQALRGPIVVGDGQGGDSVDVLRLDASNQIDLDPSLAALNVTPVLVKSSGLFDLNGNNETLGGITSLSLAGGEVRTGAGTLTLGGNLATGGATDTSLFTGTLNLGGTTRALAFSATPAATISSSTIASAVGDPVTFTFTGVANPGLSAPGGTVTFYDGAKIIGSAMLTPVPGMATQSTATLTLTTLTAGNHTIRAEYSGDGNYPPSTVNLIQTQRVFNPPVQENLSSNVNPAGPNQPVTFSYKITGPANTAAPTGTVTFFDTYNGVTSQIGSPQTLDAVGRAAVTTPGLVNTGTHVITARYSGDALYAPSITTLAPNVVVGVVPIVTASTSAEPALRGDAVTLSFKATPAGGGSTPQGTVTFFDTFTDSAGNTTTTAIPGGTNVPLDATGFASISTSFSTVGTHTITIDYSGDSFYTPSTATLNPDLVVTNPLVAFISANTNPVQVGGSTIYTITTNGLPGQPVPAGRIDLKINGAVVGAGFLNATGQTAIAVRATATGSQTVSVDFTSANDNYLSGTDVATMTPPEQVNPGGNVFLFTSSNNPALPNTPITFTLSHPQAQGTVVFRLNGTTVLGTALLNTDPFTGAFILSPASITLDGMMGRLLGLPVLPNGSYTITAVYTAAPGNAIPSQTITLQPNQFSTEPITAALTSSASPAQANTPITFTFVPAVAAQGAQPAPPPNPTGTVTFRDQTTGAILGTAPLAVDPISGRLQAQLTLPNGLTAGNHNITASYSGDSVYSTFTTALVPTQTVIGGNQVQTSVSSSANTAVLGTNVTFTYTAGGGNLQLPPTGTVTFFDGTTPIGVAQVLSGGVASISTAALTVGVHNITARYSGDANYVASTTTLSPRQRIVNPPFAQLALDLTPTDYTGSVPALDPTTGAPTQVTGQQVIFTVNLRTNTLPNVTTPLATGTVRFFAAPIINGVVGARVQIGMDQTLAGVPAGNPTNATASVIVPTGFATGSYRITAEYSGDTRYEPLTLTLNPDLTIVATAAQLPAQSASSSVAAQQPGLELRGAIAGTTPAGGTPPGIIKSGVGTLTLSGASTYPGTTTINGTGGSIALTVDNALPVGTDLIINSGTFDLNGKAQTVASLSGNSGGIVAFTGGGTLTAGAGGTDSSFDGVLTGAGTLTKVGAGTLTLSRGSNPGFTGTLNATAGTLVVNANYGTATATAQSGGTLSGAGGTVGTTTIGTGGTLAPGTNGQPGSFNTGAVTFNGGAFAVDLARVGGTLTADLLTATALTVGSAAPVLKLNTAAYTGMSLADPAVTILTVTGAGGLPAGFRFSRADGTIINDGEYVGVGGRAFQVRYTATGVTVEFAGLLTVGTFAATPNPSDPGAGHPVTITVTFGPGAPGDPPPTGTVTFTDSLGGTFTTPVITTDANGNLVATTTGLFPALGTHVVTASFSGSTNGYVDTSSSYNQVVNIATTTTLTTSNPSVGAGQSVTFTATVTSTGTPTGTVTFVNMTTNEALGTVALDANGQASLTTTVAPGSNTIRAFYSGDATFRVSTADVTQVVVSASQSQQPYYTNAFVINGLLVLQGSGVPGGIAVIPVPAGSSALFTDVNGDGNGDVILILPNLIAVLDGKTGQPIAIAADVNGDGVRDLLIFNPDGSVTTTDGKTGRTI